MADPITPPVLIVDKNRGYREWLASEIYTGSGTGRYVPNVDDSVRDWTQGVLRVISVDYSTGLSVTKLWTPPNDPSAISDADILLGAGPGYQSESYRAYIDQSVLPHTLALDKRVHIYGSTASYIKLFRGTDISVTGEVVSQMYDSGGTFLGENIPLELVAVPAFQGRSLITNGTSVAELAMDVTNMAIKTPKVGYTTKSFSDGDVVTAVVYDDAGGVVSIAKFLVKNTAFIRTTDASTKYIKSISVETPFLSQSDPKTIQYPINMPVSALNLIGVVTYSDGSQLRMPVDGTKFSMYGLQDFIATIEGQTMDVVLSYALSPGEVNYITESSPSKHIGEAYKVTTIKADGAYSIKLFVSPVWIDALNGYSLDYFLYNLDREDVYPVTNLVQMGSDSRAFNPTQYGTVQKISVGINLNEVDPSFANYRHVQEFDITLLKQGTDKTGDNWTVGYTSGQNPPYGVGVKAMAKFINVGNWQLDLSCGLTTVADWLNKVFYPTQPLFDPGSEAKAPAPNFFALVYGNTRLEVPISQWNSTIVMGETFVDGKVLNVEFFLRNASTDLQLGVSGMIVHFPA
jgi:hypothetical protein